MRVLIFSQYYWSEGFGITGVAKKLSNTGIKVDVLTGKPNYPRCEIFDGYQTCGRQDETRDGIRINSVPLNGRASVALCLAFN